LCPSQYSFLQWSQKNLQKPILPIISIISKEAKNHTNHSDQNVKKPCGIEILTTEGPTLAAAFAIVSLPKQPHGFDPSWTSPEVSLDMSDEGTGLTLYEDSGIIPTNSILIVTESSNHT
jgi:hypothetical protein